MFSEENLQCCLFPPVIPLSVKTPHAAYFLPPLDDTHGGYVAIAYWNYGLQAHNSHINMPGIKL